MGRTKETKKGWFQERSICMYHIQQRLPHTTTQLELSFISSFPEGVARKNAPREVANWRDQPFAVQTFDEYSNTPWQKTPQVTCWHILNQPGAPYQKHLQIGPQNTGWCGGPRSTRRSHWCRFSAALLRFGDFCRSVASCWPTGPTASGVTNSTGANMAKSRSTPKWTLDSLDVAEPWNTQSTDTSPTTWYQSGQINSSQNLSEFIEGNAFVCWGHVISRGSVWRPSAKQPISIEPAGSRQPASLGGSDRLSNLGVFQPTT